MKVKNFAFFGIMASILAVSGAYAEGGTIIASKGYVDAQVTPKQNKLQSTGDNANIVDEGTGTFITGITGDGTGTVTITRGDPAAVSVPVKGVQRNSTDLTPDANGKVNVVVPVLGVQRNSTDLTPDANGKVNITVPDAQIPSDWAQTNTDAVDFIKNKPTIYYGGSPAETRTGEGGETQILIPQPEAVNVPVLGVQRNGADLTPDSTTKKVNVEVPVLGVQRNGSDLTPDTTTHKVNVEVPILTVQKNGTNLTPNNGVVNVTVPTAVSDLTNDSGFITSLEAVPKTAYTFKDDAAGNTLNSISSASEAATCSKRSPCVLSYFRDGDRGYYKWANLETNGEDAVVDTAAPTQTGGGNNNNPVEVQE